MPPPSDTHDVIVVGAGISGLTAAIALQARGFQVRVFDSRDTAGGLCGTHVIDGYEFTIACNDFGAAFEQAMGELGVDIAFHHPRSLLCTERATYSLPVRLASVRPFLPVGPDLLRFLRALRGIQRRGEPVFVADLLDRAVKGREFADFVATVCWAFGSPPRRFRADMFAALFARDLGYGYDHPVTPIGGTATLADRMARRLLDLGGHLDLGVTVTDISHGHGPKTISTDHGVHHTRHVVSSQRRLDRYPSDAEPGLSVATMHIATAPDTPFPEDVHTVMHVPAGLPGLLARLDAGELPTTFAFNVFPCDLPGERNYRSFNAYLMCPRGTDDLDSADRDHIQAYMFDRIDTMLPGFVPTIRYHRLVAPHEFQKLHGLSSTLAPAILPPGFTKPDNYEPEHDIYYVGNTVQPPCEHAGSALVSGLRVAEAIAVRDGSDARG
ncbi:phytoene desaturase family protein [Nocardia suismassiliense]|uniref:phytoene desaturase family protein n=1 Tax=Nocardia suismassiliense TaxID=2077092 RepID=UPI00131F1149|nr:FAD-dependent oxidoreductase [Nocardia suismassiliense]